MKYSLGTVAKLNGLDDLIMIVGYNGNNKSNPEHKFEYVGVNFPNGVSKENKACYFDNIHISKIVFNGYSPNNGVDNKLNDSYIFDDKGIVIGVEDNISKKASQAQGGYVFDDKGIVIGVEDNTSKKASQTQGGYVFNDKGIVVGVEDNTSKKASQAQGGYVFDESGIVIDVVEDSSSSV